MGRRFLLVLLLLGLVGCSGSPLAPVEAAHPQAPGPAAAPPATRTKAATTAKVSKLLVFLVENHSLAQMKAGMPYTFAQARRYGYATHYKAIKHPSLPNYLAITGGRTHGIADDHNPSSHKLTNQSVFAQALAAHLTAKVYADGMSGTCALINGGNHYAVRHNPWTYYVRERSACQRYDVPATQLAGDVARGQLPTAGMVIPNICNDAHDCGLAVADRWFAAQMRTIYSGPDWKSGRLAVVLTADEDDHHAGNTILTAVLHPSQHGHVVATKLTHYSLTRLYEEVAGTKYLYNAAHASSMARAFGLPLAR